MGKSIYDVVLFDLDGTLTDPCEGITAAAKHALKQYGIVEEEMEKLHRFIGPPLGDSFMEFYGFNRQRAEEATEHFREFFSVDGVRLNIVYPGVREMLKDLKEQKKTIVLATSKPELFATEILELFGLTQYFAHIGGATMNSVRTKKEDVIEYILGRAGIDNPQSAVMVGDRKYDIIGANTHGMDSIGVLYGYGSRDELVGAGANYIAENPAEVAKIILP